MTLHRARALPIPPARHLMILAYAATVVGLVVYINIGRAADRSNTLDCVEQVLARTHDVTDTRTKAATEKDRATLERIEAMRKIVDLRLPDPSRYDDLLEALRQAHHDASIREERELRKLIAVRKANMPPDVRAVC